MSVTRTATFEASPGDSQAAMLNKFFLGIVGSLLTAAIIANCTLLFRMSERLTAVETKLEILASKTQATKSP